jgi:hypothetical protein
MRRFIVFIVALAALSLVAGQASALTYTVDQIKGVCGKKYAEGGPGHRGACIAAEINNVIMTAIRRLTSAQVKLLGRLALPVVETQILAIGDDLYWSDATGADV